MSNMKLITILAVAAIGASARFGYANSAYIQQKDKQQSEHEKALAKKQRVREQILARRAAKGGSQ